MLSPEKKIISPGRATLKSFADFLQPPPKVTQDEQQHDNRQHTTHEQVEQPLDDEVSTT